MEQLKRIIGEDKTRIIKMCEDKAVKESGLIGDQAFGKESTRHNLDLLHDLETLLGVPCLLPLLESINSLMKFSPSSHIFVSDNVAAVKIF